MNWPPSQEIGAECVGDLICSQASSSSQSSTVLSPVFLSNLALVFNDLLIFRLAIRIQASDKGTKDPATPPRPRPFREDPGIAQRPQRRQRPSQPLALCPHALFTLQPTLGSRSRQPGSRHPGSPQLSPPTLSTYCRPPHLLTLATPLYDTLIIPNIDGSTCLPARRSSPVCNG